MFRKYFIILIFIVSCEPQEASNIYKAPNSPKYIETFTGLESLDDTQIISIKSSLEDFLNVENIKLNENFSFYINIRDIPCLLYTSPSPRDRTRSRMPSSA